MRREEGCKCKCCLQLIQVSDVLYSRSELDYLVKKKHKYGPGGKFDLDRKASTASSGPPGPPGDAPPPGGPPGKSARAKPAWRTVTRRSPRKQKQKNPVVPSAVVTPQVMSWATWQPDPNMPPSPTSVEPTLLIPRGGSPGLFRPRSPRASYVPSVASNIPATPMRGLDPRAQVTSWVTWQPDPNMGPSPPPGEPTLLIPDRGSPGPGSPRDSYGK